MEPYQQPAPPVNPYDFLNSPGKPPKRPLIGGDSFVKRIILVVGGAVIFMIVAAIIISLLSGGGGGPTASLKKLSAQQEEIVRIADIGATKSQSLDTRALAVTAKLSIATQQQELNGLLASRKIKLTKEELALELNPKVDEILDTAVTNNRFDEVFTAELNDLILKYAKLLQDTYNATGNEATKAVLTESYNSTVQLLPQAEQPAS